MMTKFASEKELLDYLDVKMSEAGTYAVCKKCSEGKDGGCCLPVNCAFYTKDGCTNKKLECALMLCTKLMFKFPSMAEEFDKIRKTVKYKQVAIFPVEVK